MQAFPATTPDWLRPTTFTVELPQRRELLAVAFEGGAEGEVSGRLVDAGTGREEDFPAEAAGAIVLIQRKDVLFSDMARRAQDAGAVAIVVANREPGIFLAAIDPPSSLPAAGIDQAEGEALRELLTGGPVQVSLRIEREDVTAHNVIARPDSGECRTLSGGHYDTVPWAPGANDNASGSALVLELARAAAAAGLSGHCFALFGAEEPGLVGSAFFVAELSGEEREALAVYFNYDVVAGDAPPLLVGGGELLDRAEALAGRTGVDLAAGSLPEGASSDHASFLEADIAALMLTTEFRLAHTEEDTLANLDAALLEPIATLGFALLQEAGRES